MPRRRARFSTICLAAFLCLLPRPLSAQSAGTEAVWRQMFKRPDTPPAPADNPLTPEAVALGAQLFADPRLSGAGRHSCASCHRPERAFTDGRQRARALTGAPLRRNTPALWNLAWSKQFFWDGRAPSLEAQVRMPIEAADEMGGDWPIILQRLEADAALVGQFRVAFPREAAVSEETVVKALASYVRTLVSPPTRFDAWIDGDAGALNSGELRGFRLFTGKAGCVLCHVGWRFTDDRFHDTAPYMHDGSLPTLAAVLRHYTGGFIARPALAPHINRRLRLTAREKADLVAFLRTLSSKKAAP
jgi:cytochrome c peroxidase